MLVLSSGCCFWILEGGDGYNNGDIKTRKTVEAVELNAEQLGLQRSEQLRQLYESLSPALNLQDLQQLYLRKISQILSGITWFPGIKRYQLEGKWLEEALEKKKPSHPSEVIEKDIFEVHMMHDKGLLESTAKNGVKNDAPRPKADEIAETMCYQRGNEGKN
ncbi:hypothetical protein J1N35_016977 [Gossypium stocksii]|uniref:Uncharacterized protein n=1 Tax=Gossypium stocksii TaxID=47602 RepID=A0A9D3VNF3_9ROSI|nr:hypothetical protein J1N35_016977 [Gossypium stocksii]